MSDHRGFSPLRLVHTVRFFLIVTAFLKWVTWESMEVFTLCVFLR